MNYLKAYIKLVRKAQRRDIKPKICEKHHVFPESIYGKNNYKVKLTPREHYIAHAILYKALTKRYGKMHWKTKKMGHAFWRMQFRGQHHKEKYTNSYLYEIARSVYCDSIKGSNNYMYGKKGADNPNHGKKFSQEHKNKIRLSRIGTFHSEESIKLMSRSKLGKSNPAYGRTGDKHPMYGIKGDKHPNFGKKRFTNGIDNILAFECPEGYRPGLTRNVKKKYEF